MKNREAACFAICATPRCTICAGDACIIAGLKNNNAEAMQLAATIENTFEELVI